MKKPFVYWLTRSHKHRCQHLLCCNMFVYFYDANHRDKISASACIFGSTYWNQTKIVRSDIQPLIKSLANRMGSIKYLSVSNGSWRPDSVFEVCDCKATGRCEISTTNGRILHDMWLKINHVVKGESVHNVCYFPIPNAFIHLNAHTSDILPSPFNEDIYRRAYRFKAW